MGTKDRHDWLITKRACVKCLYGCFVKSLGACRRHPPSYDGCWPHVEANTWCGEFMPLDGFFDNAPDAGKTIPREAKRRKARP